MNGGYNICIFAFADLGKPPPPLSKKKILPGKSFCAFVRAEWWTKVVMRGCHPPPPPFKTQMSRQSFGRGQYVTSMPGLVSTPDGDRFMYGMSYDIRSVGHGMLREVCLMVDIQAYM